MPTSEETTSRKIYETNQLKLVVCQIRFPVLHQFEESGFLARFQEALAADYPRSSLEQQIGVAVGPGGATTIPSQPQYWRFRGLDDAWSVALARDFVSVETTAYEQFEVFQARLEPVLNGLQALGVKVRERLGLRYVNEIRFPDARGPSDWRQYLKPELVGMVGGPELGDNVIHAIQDIRLREEDGVLVIRHGYVGPVPSNDDPFYLLDIDVFDERPTPFSVEQTREQITAFHKRADHVWEMSITDELREQLGVREEAHV